MIPIYCCTEPCVHSFPFLYPAQIRIFPSPAPVWVKPCKLRFRRQNFLPRTSLDVCIFMQNICSSATTLYVLPFARLRLNFKSLERRILRPESFPEMSFAREGPAEMQCCVIEEGERCAYPATPSATFNRKLLKNVSQKRQRYSSDPEVRAPRLGCQNFSLKYLNLWRVQLLKIGLTPS